MKQGDNLSADALCTLSSATSRKASRHFIQNAAFVKQFYDGYLLWVVHTPSKSLVSNALTKRVTAAEQKWSADDIRGYRHHPTDVDSLEHVPIKRSDHYDMWPVIPYSATADYDRL